MQEIHASTSGGYRVDVRARDVTTVMDEPVERGGQNAAPTPMETMLAALGGCTAITLKMYSERKGWPLEDVQVHVRHDPGEKGAASRVTQVVTLVGEGLDEEQRERLRQIAGRCPVHRLMEGPVEFEERLATPSAGDPA